MMDSSDNSKAIAIIGMAGRFPKSANISQFWENLCEGVDCVSEIQESDLEHTDIDLFTNNPSYVKQAAIVDDADKFDAEFFGIFPSKAVSMDPQHRLFIECCWHAIEDAGYAPSTHTNSIGVFAGCYMNTYVLAALRSNPSIAFELADVFHGGSFQNEIGFEKDYLATQVSYYLDLHGPSLTIQTACSTSLVAIATACQSLVNGEADMALAGASTLRFPQQRGYQHEDGGMMSKSGRCRVFDAAADGTLFGNGVAAVLLKPLTTAQRDGDDIYAVIKGWGLNNDGQRKSSYTAPSPHGQMDAIHKAQKMAGIKGESISLVEAHGTGTTLGDPIEVKALSDEFRKSTDEKQYCAIGSVKSNIGHLDCAAGIAGMIKVALSLHHKKIPASLHFNDENPAIDFANSPFFVNTELKPWDHHSGPRRAALSSFGVGGTNAHLVLEEAPEPISTNESEEHYHLLTLSARDSQALTEKVADMAQFLKSEPKTDFASVCNTANKGRDVFAKRSFIVAKTSAEAIEKLQSIQPIPMQADKNTVPENVCFMFPGQGAQYLNMGKEFHASERAFRQSFEQCSEILLPHLGESLQDLLFSPDSESVEQQRKITQTKYAQPLISAISYSLAQMWISWGVQPTAVIGHSVGEFVAGCLSGIFSIEDALSLVAKRGQLMQSLPAGLMVAVRADVDTLLPMLDGVDIGACNSPQLTVVSGSKERITNLETKLQEREFIFQRLHTSHAFHSSMMDPILPDFKDAILNVTMQSPHLPMVSTVTGTWISEDESCSEDYWTSNIRKPVLFSEGIQTLLNEYSGCFLEVGPGQTLSTLTQQRQGQHGRQTILSSCSHPKSGQSELAVAYDAAGQLWSQGYNIDTNNIDLNSSSNRVHLPGYPFQRKRFWYPTNNNETTSFLNSAASNSSTESFARDSIENVAVEPRSADSHAETSIFEQQLELMQMQLSVLKH